MIKPKNQRKRILNRIILTKKIPTRHLLLDALNSKLKVEIKTPTLDKYLKENKISFNSEKGYYEFDDDSTRQKAINSLISSYKKKYKIVIEEPVLLGHSIINNQNSLYLFIIHCSYSHEKNVYAKIKNYINPISYQVNSKSIFFYFSNEEDAKIAYELLNNK